MTCFIGKGVLHTVDADGKELKFDLNNVRFTPVGIDVDNHSGEVIMSGRAEPVDLRINWAAGTSFHIDCETNFSHPGFSNIADYRELYEHTLNGFRDFSKGLALIELKGAVRKMIEAAIAPPKNKPYYRKFEKRGKKW